MKEIDLYSEAKLRYHQLIPNKEDGLVILALYQKYGQQSKKFLHCGIYNLKSKWNECIYKLFFKGF